MPRHSAIPTYRCATQTELPLVSSFDGGRLTSDGGLPWLAEVEAQLGICRAFAACVPEWRRGPVIHSLETLVRQRVFQIACGYEDQDDADTLRVHPLLKLVCGRLQETGINLASQSTTSRLGNAVHSHACTDLSWRELHDQDETHLKTNPYLCRVWHSRGQQPTLPAARTHRRVTTFGSMDAFGRGRVEVDCVAQDSAAFGLSLDALDALEARHTATGRENDLVLDNGPCHTSRASRAQRAVWLHVTWLAKYRPELNPIEHEWRQLKRDVRSHPTCSLRAFVDKILDGLHHLGGDRLDIVDQVPDWFLASRRPAAPPAAPRAPKTPTSGRSAAGTYQRLLSSPPLFTRAWIDPRTF